MKRILLFSTPTEKNIKRICDLLFPQDMSDKILAYMPSDGADCPAKYRMYWQDLAQKSNTTFNYVDNSVQNEEELDKILSANILLITGGNTFRLIHNLRKTGLDAIIKKFATKKNFVLAGFSAGAIVLTPNIGVCTIGDYDQNNDHISDLSGLSLVP